MNTSLRLNAVSVTGKRDAGIKIIFHRERSPAKLLIIDDNILQAKIIAKPARTLCLKQFESEITKYKNICKPANNAKVYRHIRNEVSGSSTKPLPKVFIKSPTESRYSVGLISKSESTKTIMLAADHITEEMNFVKM